MAIVEDITAEESQQDDGTRTREQLIEDVGKLTRELTVPPELVPGFMSSQDEHGLLRYRIKALRLLQDIQKQIESPNWQDMEPEMQLRLIENVLRLNGDDPWSSIEIRSIVQKIIPHLSSSLPLLILQSLKPHFSPHPSLSSSHRALSRPIGGADSSIDLHDSQPFKEPSSWGVNNLLSYAVQHLAPGEIERNIGLVLPPTLVLMDDWEPSYRLKGAQVLDIWVDKVESTIMRRMGIDKLLIDSLIHTISLSSNPPLKGLLGTSLKVVERCTEPGTRQRTIYYSEIVEKGIIQGWTYAPSGIEGRGVLMNINEMVEEMSEVMGSGILRWLKNIIPNLLQPLQYPPTTLVLPHYQSNLNCLLHVMRTVRKTGRIERWRGQILNILCRLWVQLRERTGLDDLEEDGLEAKSDDLEKDIRSLIQRIFQELAQQVPSVKEEEYKRLLNLSPGMFGDLIPA
ncbi:hypothetical protein I302_102204 [Kwoniella bestiolae CBS 10118]|uniref:Uncharacterized protein n=1 Tax=Kwoniella bestiolae CBS 10118 TaxID=1296100 RepID=A0A1B9GEG7_9TREE|nr:hypothetical protein I302_00893 [Kwoniella bestiolae CBS 10118]OCF29389.1 hypothetical protein I302_00893 [Kwoniella bestiolae CBS 10118]